jgi:SAM-dependent methyltransferase
LYARLAEFCRRPEPFSRSTIDRLWTDPHIAAQMLRFHLDPETDAASRRPATIDGFVGWLDAHFQLPGRSVTDLGCGPGLYTQRLATRGARVTGLDLSASSLAHARQAAATAGLGIDYRQADYLRDDLPAQSDLVIQIYGDFCALAPDKRALLLQKVRASLAPGGSFVFDVFSLGQYGELAEREAFGHRFMDGFWSAADYIGFQRTFLYPGHAISLDRYLVVEPHRSFEICNWMQYYTPESIAAELAQSGFRMAAAREFSTGGTWTAGPTAFAVIAEPV